MAKKILVIDGYIGAYAFSKQYVRNFLNEAGKNPVEIQVNSLGGSVDDAISINNQIMEHGDVTIVYSAFNASSATILGLGAKHIIIHSNSFYLVHKPMFWVDEWGTKNEDDIDQLIAKLEKKKEDLAKITMSIAKMYMTKTGKPLQEVMDLMKKNAWLTAQEALEFGFVDEVVEPAQAINHLENERMVAMISGNDLPPLPRQNPPASQPVNHDEEPVTRSWIENVLSRFIPKKESTQNNNSTQMKKFDFLNKTLGVDGLEQAEDKGVYLNEEQLTLINTALQAREDAETARTTAETNLSNAMASLDEIDPSVAAATELSGKVDAIKTRIAAKPGATATGAQTKGDPVDEPVEDWGTIDSLPHNRELDANS